MAETPHDATFRPGDTVAVNAVVTRRGPGNRSEIELAHFSFDLSGGSRTYRLRSAVQGGSRAKKRSRPEPPPPRLGRKRARRQSRRDGQERRKPAPGAMADGPARRRGPGC